MTKILALDTSTDACSVALAVDGVTTHIFELAAKTHTQRLLPMVDELLRASGCGLVDLDAIAYGRGPGSFTGLRICMGVVQGLAFGANLPVIPISSLQAMAQGYAAEYSDNSLPILTALDARMDEIYWGLFGADDAVSARSEEFVMRPEELSQQAIVTTLANQFVALGPGWHYPQLEVFTPAVRIDNIAPNAKDILKLALKAYAQGQSCSILDAQPVYLRDSVSWKKRERIRPQPL